MEQMAAHAEGVIALTGCLQSRFCQHLLDGRPSEARAHADELIEAFGADNVYFEVQKNGLAAQDQANEGIVRIAREVGRPLVGTGDVHYLRREDYHHHAALLCVQTKSTLGAAEDQLRHQRVLPALDRGDGQCVRGVARGAREHARDRRALRRRARARPPADPALSDARRRVGGRVPARAGAARGCATRYGDPVPAEALERAEYELGVIDRMGFNAYFLIVWDFVKYAKDSGIAVGPGRGSAAGSIVAYCAADHRRRSAALRPAVRALPEPRARVDAGHRHRLLGARPRARDPLRDREVRQGVGRADRHLRQDVPARGHARRRPRARPRLRRRRPAGEADPRPDHGPAAELRGLPEAGPAAARRGRPRRHRPSRSSTSPRASRGSSATPRSTPPRS